MLRFQWNALRRGHQVLVHDPGSAEMTLVPGSVVMLEPHTGRRGLNGVGIRVAGEDGSSTVLWPPYLTVHLDPRDSTEPCWRCDEIAAAEPAVRQCGRCRRTFPGDPTLPRGVELGWWACPPCDERLIGAGALAKPVWAAKVATGDHR